MIGDAFVVKQELFERIQKLANDPEQQGKSLRNELARLRSEGRLRTLLKQMEPGRSEEWGKKQLKIVFLSPHDSPDTLTLPDDIVHDSTTGSGRGTAFTQGQRYVSLSRLEKGPKTASELV